MCVYKVGECNECVCTKWENVMIGVKDVGKSIIGVRSECDDELERQHYRKKTVDECNDWGEICW